MYQLQCIQDCFVVLTENGEIVHTWTYLNVVDWDVEEVITSFKMTGVFICIYDSFFV
jgi:hypothetical protein